MSTVTISGSRQKVLSRELAFVDVQSPDLNLRSGIPKNLDALGPDIGVVMFI
jgi:hypothetical protein